MLRLNPYKLLRNLIHEPPLLVGDVLAVDNGTAIIEVPGGGRLTARGDVQVGDRVYFRDGVIEGQAPNLPVELIEV